ncbi:MAG TPA: hypothetical protein VF536_19715, partial [Roseateles sp.]
MFKRTSTSVAVTAKGLRPGLRWALGLSAVASVWAMLAPADPPVVAATAPAPRPSTPTAARTAAPGQSLALAAIPARLPEQPLEPADRDPFLIPQPR